VLYGSVVVATVVSRALAFAVPHWIGSILEAVQPLMGLATSVLAMAWLYAAWKGVPETHRGTVSPRRAALSFLVPFYNVYWALAVNLALCDTLGHILSRADRHWRTARTLAVVAFCAWVSAFVLGAAQGAAGRSVTAVQWILVPAATGGLWLAYAIVCDLARDAVVRLGDGAIASPRLTPLQRQRGPNILLTAGLSFALLFGFLVIWQYLAPAER
jgi:hypothetical protein